jgi:hypothetical protein
MGKNLKGKELEKWRRNDASQNKKRRKYLKIKEM